MSTRPYNRERSVPPCQEELLGLFDALVNVIFCIKAGDGTYVAVNRAFVRRTGRRSKREVLDRRAEDLFVTPLAERYQAQDRWVFDRGTPLRDELELIRRESGDYGWYLTTKLPVIDSDSGITRWLVSVSRDLATPDVDEPAMLSMQGVVNHVKNGLDRAFSVAELAEVAACSVSTLKRRMKRVFGLSVTQYILRSRVDRAVELLTSTSTTVAEIAALVGFYDQADMTRRFAALTGETPAQYRLSHSRKSSQPFSSRNHLG